MLSYNIQDFMPILVNKYLDIKVNDIVHVDMEVYGFPPYRQRIP